MANQTLRSTVVRLSPLLCHEDRDPLTLFFLSRKTPTYSILTSSRYAAHAATPAMPRCPSAQLSLISIGR
jgi:hypothetical protein